QLQTELGEERRGGREVVHDDADVVHPLDRPAPRVGGPLASVVHDGLLPGRPAGGAAARVRVQARWRSCCCCMRLGDGGGQGCLEGPKTATEDELGPQPRPYPPLPTGTGQPYRGCPPGRGRADAGVAGPPSRTPRRSPSQSCAPPAATPRSRIVPVVGY